MGLLEAWKFIRKQCGSAISMRGWRGEYWLVDAMRAPEKLEHICTPKPRHDFLYFAMFSSFPATRRERHVFVWNDVKSWTPSKILSREDRGILFDFSSSLSPFRLFGFSFFWCFFFPLDSQQFNSCTFGCECSERHPPKIEKVKKWKVKKCPFRLFDFSAFRLFGFSSSLSALNALNCVLLAAHVQLEKHPAKIQSQKVKSQFFDFSKFNITRSYFSILRLFEIHKKAPFHLTIFCISTFRNSIRNLSIFRLFVFRLFEIDLNTFRQEPCSTFFLPSFSPYFIHLILSRVSQITAINEHSPP